MQEATFIHSNSGYAKANRFLENETKIRSNIMFNEKGSDRILDKKVRYISESSVIY
jgi:hypothetical protein